MRTAIPFVYLALTVLALPTASLPAQEEEAPQRDVTARRQGLSVNLGVHTGETRGSISQGGAMNGGGGIAYERPIGARFSWRAEISTEGFATDVGITNDGTSDYPSELRFSRNSFGGSVRRYASNGLFLGVGAAVKFTQGCRVYLLGRDRFSGGRSEPCDNMSTTPPFETVSQSQALVLGGGIQRGRWELEVRYDQTLGTSVRSESRTGTAYFLGAFLHYRFGKRPTPG